MKRRRLIAWGSAVSGLVAALIGGEALAQGASSDQPKIDIRRMSKINRMPVATPRFNVTGVSPSRNRKVWQRVLVNYDTEYEHDQAWMDNLIISYHVMCKRTEKGKVAFSLFRLNVSYSDIAEGRDHRAAAYLRPPAIERFGEVEAVAVEFKVGNEVVATETEKPGSFPDDWWENRQVVDSDKVTIRAGYLLNRKDTPFYLVNYDDYEVIK